MKLFRYWVTFEMGFVLLWSTSLKPFINSKKQTNKNQPTKKTQKQHKNQIIKYKKLQA